MVAFYFTGRHQSGFLDAQKGGVFTSCITWDVMFDHFLHMYVLKSKIKKALNSYMSSPTTAEQYFAVSSRKTVLSQSCMVMWMVYHLF